MPGRRQIIWIFRRCGTRQRFRFDMLRFDIIFTILHSTSILNHAKYQIAIAEILRRPRTEGCCGAVVAFRRKGGNHTSRVIFLRRGGHNYLAVMMKQGWHGWPLIERPSYQSDPYERLIFSRDQGDSWQTVDAEIIDSLVKENLMCLFEMEPHPVFDALTGEINRRKNFAVMSRNFEFFVHDPNGGDERFYMKWSALFNPSKSKYTGWIGHVRAPLRFFASGARSGSSASARSRGLTRWGTPRGGGREKRMHHSGCRRRRRVAARSRERAFLCRIYRACD